MPALDRRSFMSYFAGAGLSSTLFPGVLWAKLANGAEITVDTIASAEEMAGVHFDQTERELMLDVAIQRAVAAFHIRPTVLTLQNTCHLAMRFVKRCPILERFAQGRRLTVDNGGK